MAGYSVLERLYSATPPDAKTKADNNATLLVSWWCTLFALTGILIRISGRYIRTERLFREDKIMALSIIPLLLRMAFVHVVLVMGTNNTKTQHLSQISIQHREIGSRLVLISRIFYAAFIWTAKYTVSEFLKRVIGSHWRRSYEYGLQGIRYFLGVTFMAVVIATLAECQPFDHYYQVVPDPGPKCREGLAQLITMGVCDIITDILLVIYPIPIVMASAMPLKRKFSLTLLFMLSLGLVAITAYRIPAVISRNGDQQFRTLIASLEMLAAAAVANAIVIGSFIRDRGTKKAKWKLGSTDASSLERVPTRSNTITMHHWGSDADLVSDLGIGLHPELRRKEKAVPRPAPVAIPYSQEDARGDSNVGNKWGFRHGSHPSLDSDASGTIDAKYGLLDDDNVSPGHKTGDHDGAPIGQRKLSFFDIGGLLEVAPNGTPDRPSRRTSRSRSSINAQDAAGSVSNQARPFPQLQQGNPPRRSSRVILSDVGGLLSSHSEESRSQQSLPLGARNGLSPNRSPNFSRGSSAYASRTPQPPTTPYHDLLDDDEEDDEEDEEGHQRVSRGGTSSLIAALSTNPPGLPNGPNARAPRRGSNRPTNPSDDLELMDPGGLLH